MPDLLTPKYSARYRRPRNWSVWWLLVTVLLIAAAAVVLSSWRVRF